MIYVLWPTVRPLIARDMACKWVERSYYREGVQYCFGVEQSAGHMDAFPAIKRSTVKSIKSPHHGCCHAVTVLSTQLQCYDSDIVVLASDDFEAPLGWDDHLREQYKKAGFEALIVNDGYPVDNTIVPMPVVSGWLLKEMNGIIYNPAYRHMYSDNEFYDVITEMKVKKSLRDSKEYRFKHLHWTADGRLHDHHDSQNYEHVESDKLTYNARRLFALDGRLKLPEGWSA